MRQVLAILLLSLTVCQVTAQRLSRTYQDQSLSEVLKDLNAASSRYEVSFIYNELEDFRVTTTLHRTPLPNAVHQVVGFYPMRVTETDSVITVECIHKTERHLTGTRGLLGRIVRRSSPPRPCSSRRISSGIS